MSEYGELPNLPEDESVREACQEKAQQALRECMKKLKVAVKGKGNSKLLSDAGEIAGQVLAWTDHADLEKDVGKVLVELGIGDGFQDALRIFQDGVRLGVARHRNLEEELLRGRAAQGDMAALDASLASSPGMDPTLLRRLILSDPEGARWYVWGEVAQQYVGPFGGRVVRERFQRLCPTLHMMAADLSRVLTRRAGTVLHSDTGSLRSLDDVFQLCGSVPQYIEHVAGQAGSHWQPNGSLRVGVATFRGDLVPEENSQISRWLELLCGAQLDSFRDWLATFRQITSPTCAVYLEGTGAAGKSMLAPALARLFESRSYVRYEHVTSDFNDGLLDSALVLADERMPDQAGRRGTPSAVFRELVAADQIEINGKGTRKQRIRMAPRILITANNATAMNFTREEFTSHDVHAIADRILRISPDDGMAGAAEYLREIGGRPTTDAWVRGDGLARHVLWLEQTRTVVPGTRFLVHGGGMSAQLPAANDAGWVRELVDAIETKRSKDPAQVRAWEGKGVLLLDGWLYVRAIGLSEIWMDIMPGERHPGWREFRRILRNAGAEDCVLEHKGVRMRVLKIRT